MDVNKPSLWKSGAGGGRVMRERVLMVVVVVGGEGWVSECVCGGVAFTELFTELCEASH